jgi:hypothetical protein
MADWRRSKRTPPTDPALVAQAAANSGGSVAEIDSEFVGGNPDGYVPGEAVLGCWIVGPDGILTGEYAQNPGYGTPTDDFTKLIEMDHWWGWLPDEPAAAIRASIADVLTQQVPGAVLEWVKITGKPEVVTGGRRVAEDEGRIILVRTGLAVPFALSVKDPDNRREVLWGVFTWAASGLDGSTERRDRVWFDLHVGLEWAKQRLAQRVYEVDEA